MLARIDLFSLYVLFSQFRPRDVLHGILCGTITRSEMEKKHKSQKVYICALCQFYRNKQEQFCSIPTSVLGSLLLPPPGVKEKRRDPGNKVGRPRQLASVGRHSIGSGKGENLSPENKKVNGNSPWGLGGTDHLMFTQ